DVCTADAGSRRVPSLARAGVGGGLRGSGDQGAGRGCDLVDLCPALADGAQLEDSITQLGLLATARGRGRRVLAGVQLARRSQLGLAVRTDDADGRVHARIPDRAAR